MPGMPGGGIETVRAAALLLERVVRRLEPERGACSRPSACARAGCSCASRPRSCAQDPLLAGAARLRARPLARARASALPWRAGPRRCFPARAPAQRRLRLAVCEVSDSAWREHPAFRAREAFYRLAQYPFIGLDHAERAFLAYAVFIRYEGSPEDLFIRPIMSLLPEPERRRARAPGRHAAARLPDLGRGARSSRHQPAAIAGDELRLHLPAPDAAPDPEILHPRLRAVAQALGLGAHPGSLTDGLSDRAQAGAGPPARRAARPLRRAGRRCVAMSRKAGRWVTASTVVRSRSAAMLRQIARSDSGSRALVTSSRIRSLGRRISARASAIRCRWPPESRAPLVADHRLHAVGQLRHERARLRPSAGPRDLALTVGGIAQGQVLEHAVVEQDQLLRHVAHLLRQACRSIWARSTPSIRIRPASGRCRPSTRSIRVVLPAPDSPGQHGDAAGRDDHG